MLTLTKSQAHHVLKEVGEAWRIPKERWPDILWLKKNPSYCPGFFIPRTRSQKNVIGICDNCNANQMVVLLHELSHWVSFEKISKEIPTPHDDVFWQRTETLYRIYEVTPKEARTTEKVGYPEGWKGLRTWSSPRYLCGR